MSQLLNPNVRFSRAGLFRSEHEWIHPSRIETTYEIIYVTRGEVFLREEERELHATKGQVLLLNPYLRHEGSRKTVGTEFYWVHFRTADGKLPFERRFFDRFERGYLFKELLHWSSRPRIEEEMAGAVLCHILCELALSAERREAELDATAERVCEWIRISADASLTVCQVAEHFGFSPDHVSRLCKKSTGMSARALINRYLLANVKQMLCNTDLYVKEIAAELSFPSDKALLAYFRYHEGCTPTEFRNRFGRIHMNRK